MLANKVVKLWTAFELDEGVEKLIDLAVHGGWDQFLNLFSEPDGILGVLEETCGHL